MELWQSLVMGIVQGATEFLPVSSSGHLVLFGRAIGLTTAASADADPFMRSFATMLHLGTLVAVLIVMRREILTIFRDILGRMTWLLLLATVPAVLFAFLLGDTIDRLFSSGATLGFEFLFTGAVLFAALFAKPGVREKDALRATDALAGGIGQAVAILPAVSRSGCALVPMLFLGVERKTAIRFVFLMSIPAILGGLVLDLRELLSGGSDALLQVGAANLAVGIAAAAVSGFLAMRLMLNLLTRRGLGWFALYTVLMGLFVLLDQNLLHWIF